MLFVLKEGLTGLIRSRFSGAVAVITITISLVLIGVFLIITVNLGRFVEDLRSRLELEVFLDDSFDEPKIESLSESIRAIAGVEAVTFISKEMAVLEYQNLFKGQENEYFEVLGYNPLPASFKVRLAENHRTAIGAAQVFNTIIQMEDFSEQDVVYRQEYLVLIEKYINIAISVDFLVGAIICLSALLLVSNNIKLIIMSKARIIETMKLVGATRFFVQMPLFIQGTLQGLIGGIIATLFLYGLLKLSSVEIPGLISVQWQIYILIANLGVLLGLIGSYMAVRRYL